MSRLSIGILGLPNVGKSTLFRALTAVSVPAENYPFCTIDPNVGVVEVPDLRLDHIERLVGPKEKVRPVVEFVDIAGLVEGASRGEGLGNRFLAHVREADALAHVVRVFDEPSVVRPAGVRDAVDGLRIIETELALADLEVVTRRRDAVERLVRSGDRDAAAELRILERLESRLAEGRPARAEGLEPEDRERVKSLALLTLKPVMYVLNGEEGISGGDPEPGLETAEVVRWLQEHDPGATIVPVCARLEAEIAQLPATERREYAAALGLAESGLERMVRAGYELLGLQTFFTIGDTEVRGWTIPVGATAVEAAGEVHSDFQRGFIKAETIHYQDFVDVGSLKTARARGRIRFEGREYVVQDGDILFFRAAV